MAEIPALNKLHTTFSNSEGIGLFSLFRDSILYQNSRKLFEHKGIFKNDSSRFKVVNFHFSQTPNSQSTAKRLGIHAYPTNLIVDKAGIIRKIYIGASREESENFKIVDDIKKDIEKIKTSDYNE